MRLQDKVAIIIGAGQSEGASAAVGNGRATALVFAREGAQVLVVDRDITAALFLASDEADFITGVALPVDGGASVRVG